MNREKFEELATAYALGSLSNEELTEFKQMMQNASEDEKKLVKELTATTSFLMHTAQITEPSADLKHRIMSRISHAPQVSTEYAAPETTSLLEEISRLLGFHKPAFALAVASVLLLITASSVIWNFSLHSDLQQTEQYLAMTKSQTTGSKSDHIQIVLDSPRMAYSTLRGTELMPGSYGKLFWCQITEVGILHTNLLKPLKDGEKYSAWAFKDDVPVHIISFEADENFDNQIPIDRMSIPNADDIQHLMVTIEVDENAITPSNKVALQGSVS